MPVPLIFTTNECAWKHISMKMLTRTMTGLTAFEVKLAVEKELLFAAGAKAIDIMEGNESAAGTITVLKSELDMLNDAALSAGYASIVHVPHTLISCTVQFKKTLTSPTRIIEVPALAITDATVGMQQNSKFANVPLPFIAIEAILR